MPLDRLVIIKHTQPGYFDMHGEYVEGGSIPYQVWAELRDANFTDLAGVEGQVDRGTKTYRTRYLPLLASVSSRALTLSDGSVDDQNAVIDYSIDDFREVVGRASALRRRFHDFTILYVP